MLLHVALFHAIGSLDTWEQSCYNDLQFTHTRKVCGKYTYKKIILHVHLTLSDVSNGKDNNFNIESYKYFPLILQDFFCSCSHTCLRCRYVETNHV